MIEISESKVEKLSEHIEQGLRHMGKAMQCVEEWIDESSMGERSNYRGSSRGGNYRGGSYGNRGSMGYKDDDDEWEEMDERYGMGERRRRRSNGRYY